jgi:nickel-type superoxide dismutase maturation protease
MRRVIRVLRPLLTLVAAGLLLRRWVDIVEVRGHSMAPALLPGDRLVAVRNLRAGRMPRAGDIVLALDPRDAFRELVKRVASVDPTGIELRGDNPRHSADSVAFGRLPANAVRWRVIGRYWPPERVGRIAAAPSLEAGDSP